jgi:hypothetical protein
MKGFKLEADTMMIFIGHAMALESDDSYLQRFRKELLQKMALDANSINKFKD